MISSDGADNGLVWLNSAGKQLIVYNATNLSSILWSANLPGYTKFAIPDVTDDGYVLVGAGNDLVAFASRARFDWLPCLAHMHLDELFEYARRAARLPGSPLPSIRIGADHLAAGDGAQAAPDHAVDRCS